MRDQIDYNSSLDLGRLKFKTGIITLLVDYLAYLAILGLPLYGVWIYISRLISTNTYYHHWTDISLLVLISIAWIIYLLIWLSKVDRFYKVIGTDKRINKQIVARTLKEKKWHILRKNQNFIIAFPVTGIFKPDQQVTILFTEKEILINVITFSWRNLKSPFFPLKNRKTRKKLINEIEELLIKTLHNN
jgi:hypothetical protein